MSQLVSYSYNSFGVGGNVALGQGEISRQIHFPFAFPRPPIFQAIVIRPNEEADRINVTMRNLTATGVDVDFYSGIPETGEGEKYVLSWTAIEVF